MDTTISPAYLLRQYAWQVLKANDPTVWDETKYGGLVPIVPLNEEPELTQYSGPRIVYGYAHGGTGDLYARSSGSMTFAVYDTNFRRLAKTLTILKAAFERQDETARDVNEFTSTIPGFIGIRFGYIRVGFVEGGGPEGDEAESTEGGMQLGIINISFEYYVDYDVRTRPIVNSVGEITGWSL